MPVDESIASRLVKAGLVNVKYFEQSFIANVIADMLSPVRHIEIAVNLDYSYILGCDETITVLSETDPLEPRVALVTPHATLGRREPNIQLVQQ